MAGKYQLAYVQAFCALQSLIIAILSTSDLASFIWSLCAVAWAGSTVITVWATK